MANTTSRSKKKNVTSYDRLALEIKKKLQDLSASLREVTIDKEGWCYKYVEKKAIGDQIYKTFLDYNEKKMKEKLVFGFSDDLMEDGILSLLQGASVMASLYENFDVDIEKDKLLTLIDRVLERVDAGGELHFDATPYLPGSDQFVTKPGKKNHHYIDTLTWFTSFACNIFRLMIKKNLQIDDEQNNRTDRLLLLCNKSLKYLIDSFIEVDNSQPGPKRKFICGWNYSGECQEPSLYFTYAVSEVLIDLYDTFGNVIRADDTIRICGGVSGGRSISGKIYDTFQGFRANFLEKVRNGEEGYTDEAYADFDADLKEEEEQKKAQLRSINAQSIEACEQGYAKLEEELFLKINDDMPPYATGSPYNTLQDQCLEAAKVVWGEVKDKLTTGFFAGDLEYDIERSVIEQSISSDALFSSLFAINLIINAGLDEEYENDINYFTINGSDEYNAALERYDEICNALRLGYDHVYQTYLDMKKKKLEYKVDVFVLSFIERFDNNFERIKEMRKARIRIFSLMPLLVKTKTTIGDFVIRYPQYDMRLYLEQILDHRMKSEDGSRMWIWENDGYSSSSNYYYISALGDFYNYYEEYEAKYLDKYTENEDKIKEIRDKYLGELKGPNGAITKLNRTLEEKDKEIKELKARLSEANEQVEKLNDDPLRKALNGFIYESVKERLGALMSEMFADMAKGIATQGVQRVEARRASDNGTPQAQASEQPTPEQLKAMQDAAEKEAFEANLKKLLLSLMSEQMASEIYKEKDKRGDKISANGITMDFSKLAKNTSADLAKAIGFYLAQVLSTNRSDFVITEGYKNLRDALNYVTQIKEEKNPSKK